MKRCETVKIASGLLVHRYQIIGTEIVVHQAYEPSLPSATRCDGLVLTHNLIARFDDHPGWYGQIGTRRPTKELEASVPAGPRMAEYRTMQNAIAADAIITAFPYCNYHTCRNGEIITTVAEVERAEARAA